MRSLKYAVSDERPEPTLDVARDRSSSDGVEVILHGWRPGLDKVGLTRTLRDAGLPFGEAIAATGAVLDGREVRVRLGDRDDVAATRERFLALGVGDVRPAPSSPEP